MMLVSLERAKAQEYITHSFYDLEVQHKVAEASDIVLDYIGDRDNLRRWSAADPLPEESVAVPGVITAAVLLVFGALWEGREGAEDSPEPISPAVERLLRRYRDPVVA